MHLTIDGFRGNPERLASEELVRELLDRFPESIGMTKIAAPHVQRYVGVKPDDWGISGFVLIAESHITVHTFPDHKLVWADVFSCKGFDTEPAVRTLKEAFDLGEVRAGTLRRGLEYPHVVDEAIPLLEGERVAAVKKTGKVAAAAGRERR